MEDTFFQVFYGKAHLQQLSGFVFRLSITRSPVFVPETTLYQKVGSFTWMMACFVLAQGYSGIMTAIITKPNVPTSIKTIEDLVNQRALGWFIEDGGSILQMAKDGSPGTTRR